ncbi:MAG TPA: phospholipase D family protein [Ktedonobacteraceae bacterium]|nr:phospholipase D family protein [Ktedonobacteraceae bacterium]
MQASQGMDTPQARRWWADGDTPVRSDSRVTYMVDGRTTMLEMCRHYIKARRYIYLADWGFTPTIELVRGQDRRRGPDGSREQEQYIDELRSDGLSEEDISFWLTHDLTARAVLGYAVSKGVEVRALLWKSDPLFSHYNPQEAHQQLTEVGVTCILDDSAEGILHHPAESLHQKISVVDGTHAFVGGIDPLIESGGDYDRWDTHSHPFTTPLRRTPQGTTPHPWHDVHSIIEGPAASDVELNFRQRWNDVVERHHMGKDLLIPDHPAPPPVQSQTIVQVARTIPEHTYKFITADGIAQLYANALNNVQRFVYLENQYLWLRAYTGIDLPLLGKDSPDMEHNLRELGAALQRGAIVTIILPDHPNVGRAFTDAGLVRLREEASEALEEGRLEAFCLATSTRQNGRERYRPIYVHAKVAIIDDIWTTVGSANLNNRGMRDDTEMNVAALDADLAYNLRLMLQGEHLGLVHEEDLFALSRMLAGQKQAMEEKERALRVQRFLQEALGDPLVALRKMHTCAWENLNRYKANQALVGHLLPYLTAQEATQQGLNFREEHGWLEEPDS